ncbi:MAG: hypothetical protein NT154_13500, partial [Verrucomicrobia bacterium]|nr:hypothetical protein [Verrucomicrobiota bacterium]
ATAFATGSTNTNQLQYSYTLGTAYTNTWSFTVGYPSLPVALAGPVDARLGVDQVVFNAGDAWIGANYGANSSQTL